MRHHVTALGLALCGGILVLGCAPQDKTTPKADEKVAKKDEPQAKSKHSGWWCTEHGIPEDECLMCLHSEDDLKKKGDWCEKHEYAKSQCFACNPKLKEKYAAQYRAKYGKEPPEADENPAKRDEEKDGDKKDAGKKDPETKDGKK
jgi:hypothetical protein